MTLSSKPSLLALSWGLMPHLSLSPHHLLGLSRLFSSLLLSPLLSHILKLLCRALLREKNILIIQARPSPAKALQSACDFFGILIFLDFDAIRSATPIILSSNCHCSPKRLLLFSRVTLVICLSPLVEMPQHRDASILFSQLAPVDYVAKATRPGALRL